MTPQDDTSLAKVGMIGLAVMGANLALNIERNGFPIAVYNREAQKVDEFLAQNPGKKIIGAHSIEELVARLERPRKIILLIKAGSPVDMVIDQLKPHLTRGDIIIDGGNSKFRRHRKARARAEERRDILHRVGRLRRRVGRALGAFAYAGRGPARPTSRYARCGKP